MHWYLLTYIFWSYVDFKKKMEMTTYLLIRIYCYTTAQIPKYLHTYYSRRQKKGLWSTVLHMQAINKTYHIHKHFLKMDITRKTLKYVSKTGLPERQQDFLKLRILGCPNDLQKLFRFIAWTFLLSTENCRNVCTTQYT